jgi:hypothetical protein
LAAASISASTIARTIARSVSSGGDAGLIDFSPKAGFLLLCHTKAWR